MNKTTAHDLMVEIAPGSDPQGMTWGGGNSNAPRNFFRLRCDQNVRNTYSIL